MAQISRPFQIALAAVALLGLVWAFALHRPSSSNSTAAKAAAEREVLAATPKASSSKGSAVAGGKSSGSGAYHGTAPGVAGLTGAVAKAHGAVAQSQKNAKQLEEKSAQASGGATPSSSSTSTTPARTSAPAKTSAPTHTTSPSTLHSTAPSLAAQHLVEDELAQGRVVALLFWSSKGADDVAVKNAIEQLAKSDHGLAVHVTGASQVASFGTITRGIQVYGTPTLLIVGKHGKTRTLTGLQDAFSIKQAISEARHS
jgi:hypothetical protein